MSAPAIPDTRAAKPRLDGFRVTPWVHHCGRFVARHPRLWIRLANFERSEEHTSELQSLMRISYAVFCLKKKKNTKTDKQRRLNTKHNSNTSCREQPNNYSTILVYHNTTHVHSSRVPRIRNE